MKQFRLYTVDHIRGSKNKAVHAVPNMPDHRLFKSLVEQSEEGFDVRSAIGDVEAMDSLTEKFFGRKIKLPSPLHDNSLFAFFEETRCLLFCLVSFEEKIYG